MVQSVTPLPTIGDIVVGRDVAGRILRISSHPEADRVVLSIWQDGRCLATVRLARADIPAVTQALVEGLVATPEPPRPGVAPAPVSRLTPPAPNPVRAAADRVTSALTTRLRRR